MNETKKRCKNGEMKNKLGICEKKTQKQTLRLNILSDKPEPIISPKSNFVFHFFTNQREEEKVRPSKLILHFCIFLCRKIGV